MRYKVVKTTMYYSLYEFMNIICYSQASCKNCPLEDGCECLRAKYLKAKPTYTVAGYYDNKNKENVTELEKEIHERLEKYYRKRSQGPIEFELLYVEEK